MASDLARTLTRSVADGGAANTGAILRLRGQTTADLREAVRRGIPFRAFEALAKHLEMPSHAVAALVGIPARTIARRKANRSLTPEESDRAYRLARVVAQATESLGSVERARVWLHAPNRALGGEAPLDLVDTDIGTRQVEETLLRLDHGFFA